ncbi:MAG: hypothetical protein P8Z72_16315 [Gammaproteobacteria bacterium]
MLKKSLAVIFCFGMLLTMTSCNYFESEQARLKKYGTLYKVNKFYQFIICTKNILQSDGNSCEARVLLGKAQFAKFSLLDAEDSFQKAEKQGCKDPQIFLYLVRMRLYRGQLAQVDALYKNPKFLHARQLPSICAILCSKSR